MIQSKEYIIHQIANDIKTHIGQKYKDKSNIYCPVQRFNSHSEGRSHALFLEALIINVS